MSGWSVTLTTLFLGKTVSMHLTELLSWHQAIYHFLQEIEIQDLLCCSEALCLGMAFLMISFPSLNFSLNFWASEIQRDIHGITVILFSVTFEPRCEKTGLQGF